MSPQRVIFTMTALFCITQAKPFKLKYIGGLLGDAQPEPKHVYRIIEAPVLTEKPVLWHPDEPSHGWENSNVVYYKDAPRYYYHQLPPVYSPPKVQPAYLPVPEHIENEVYGPPPPPSSYLPDNSNNGFGPYPEAAPQIYEPQQVYYQPHPQMNEEMATTANPLVTVLGAALKSAENIVNTLAGTASQAIGAIRKPFIVGPKMVRQYYNW